MEKGKCLKGELLLQAFKSALGAGSRPINSSICILDSIGHTFPSPSFSLRTVRACSSWFTYCFNETNDRNICRFAVFPRSELIYDRQLLFIGRGIKCNLSLSRHHMWMLWCSYHHTIELKIGTPYIVISYLIHGDMCYALCPSTMRYIRDIMKM